MVLEYLSELIWGPLIFKDGIKIKTNLEGGFKMKRLVLFVIALVFAFCTTVMAAEPTADPATKEETAKVEKADQKKAAAKKKAAQKKAAAKKKSAEKKAAAKKAAAEKKAADTKAAEPEAK